MAKNVTPSPKQEIATLMHKTQTMMVSSCYANKHGSMERKTAQEWANTVDELSKKSPDKAFDAVQYAWRHSSEDSAIREQAEAFFEKLKRFGAPTLS